MKVLYVTGACLSKNTSANMSHNGFVKGFLDCGCEVDILMANDSWGEEDKALPKWKCANYYEYDSVSAADRLRRKYKHVEANGIGTAHSARMVVQNKKVSIKQIIRSVLKRAYYIVFPIDPVYPLERHWLKTASSFKSDTEYDLVVSNSSPAASHKLVSELFKKKHILCKRWIQIWEDPWYHDLYGGHPDAVLKEECELLQAAQEIYYVSPLTLMYQKKYFPDCAEKMKCVPLPFFTFGDDNSSKEIIAECSFGYFGDYYSKTRNLKPFYEALRKSGYTGYIYGDSDEQFESTENIEISGRVTLDKLSVIQNKTGILVHLCNLCGGQIPGKIYHYSATDKPILFILDGTIEEIYEIKKFFEPFGRYYFCDNNKQDILQTMEIIISEHKSFGRVMDFSPYEVVKKMSI